MNYQTIEVSVKDPSVTLSFKRPFINLLLLDEINHLLDDVEKNPACLIIVLKGNQEVFSAGMDFKELGKGQEDTIDRWTKRYFATLKRLIQFPKCVVSYVEGNVYAGGVGFVAASDLCFAKKSASFKLTELSFGLLPAMVSPFLIRKIGFSKASELALTGKEMTFEDAMDAHLVNFPIKKFKSVMESVEKLTSETIKNYKSYFNTLYPIDEGVERLATHETKRLLLQPIVQDNIASFIVKRKG